MNLTGSQYQQLRDALLSAFPTPAKLEDMVRIHLDKNLAAIATSDDLKEIVFKLIKAAEAEGWTAELILAARESNPGNVQLMTVAHQLSLTPVAPPSQNLERIIKENNRFQDVQSWLTQLSSIEKQVCRIEIKINNRKINGTGFLVGPDLVMTNYHVIDTVKEMNIHENVTLRFDYKRLADGTTVQSGTCFVLSKDWLVDSSPLSPVDIESVPKSRLPLTDELDYALLRVAGNPGTMPVSGQDNQNSQKRGWIQIPEISYDFLPHTPLFIVQHPKGDPIKLSLDTDAIIGCNDNCTRVMYRTNTLGGSSGSPCFNADWELVALHHSGDPDFDPAHKPVYNEGIPISTILALLKQRGLEKFLGE